MSKKELLARIEKLEEQVAGMQAEINLLEMGTRKSNPRPEWIPQPVPYWQPTYTNPYIVTCGTKTGG